MKRYTSKIKRKRGYTRRNKKKNNFKGSRKKHRRKGTTRKNKKLIFNMRGGVKQAILNRTQIEVLDPGEYITLGDDKQRKDYFVNLIRFLDVNKIKAPTIEEYNRNNREWQIQKYGQMYNEALNRGLFSDVATGSFGDGGVSSSPSTPRARGIAPGIVVLGSPEQSSPTSFATQKDDQVDYQLNPTIINPIVEDNAYEVNISQDGNGDRMINIIDNSTQTHVKSYYNDNGDEISYGTKGDVVILENIADIIHDIINEGFLTYDAFLSVKLIVKSFSPLYGFTEDESWEICCRPLHREMYDKIDDLLRIIKKKNAKKWKTDYYNLIENEKIRINTLYGATFFLSNDGIIQDFQLNLNEEDDEYLPINDFAKFRVMEKCFHLLDVENGLTWEQYFKFYIELCQSGNSKTIGGNLEEIYKHEIYDNYCKNKFCFNFKNTKLGLEAEVALKYSRINEKSSIMAYGVGGKENGIAIWKKILGAGNNFLYDKPTLPSNVFENFSIRQPTQKDRLEYSQPITMDTMKRFLTTPDNVEINIGNPPIDYRAYIRHYLVYFMYCLWGDKAITSVIKRELIHLFRERYIYNQSYISVKSKSIHSYKQNHLYDAVLHLNFTDAGDKMASATPDLYQQILFQEELGMTMDGIFEQAAVPNACDEATSRLGPVFNLTESGITRFPVCNFDPTFTYDEALKANFCVYYKQRNGKNTYLKVKQFLANSDADKKSLGIANITDLNEIYTGILNDIRYLYGNIIDTKKMNTKRKIEMKFNYFCLYLLCFNLEIIDTDNDLNEKLTRLDDEIKNPYFFQSDFCKAIQGGMKEGFLDGFFSLHGSYQVEKQWYKHFPHQDEMDGMEGNREHDWVEKTPFYKTGINTSHTIIDYAEKVFSGDNKKLYEKKNGNLIVESSSTNKTKTIEKLKTRPANASVFHEFLLIPDAFNKLKEKIILSKYWFDRTYRMCYGNKIGFEQVVAVDTSYWLWKGKCISITVDDILRLFPRIAGDSKKSYTDYKVYIKKKIQEKIDDITEKIGAAQARQNQEFDDATKEAAASEVLALTPHLAALTGISKNNYFDEMNKKGQNKISVLKNKQNKYEIFLTYEDIQPSVNNIDPIKFFSTVYDTVGELEAQLRRFTYLETTLKYTGQFGNQYTTSEYKRFVDGIKLNNNVDNDPLLNVLKRKLSILLTSNTTEKETILERVAGLNDQQWYNTLQPLFNRPVIKLLYNFILFDFEPFAGEKISRTTGRGMSVQEMGIPTFIQKCLDMAIESYDNTSTGVQEISIVQLNPDNNSIIKESKSFIQGKPSVTTTLSENRQYVVYMLLKYKKLSKQLAKEILDHLSKAWWNSKKRTEEEHTNVQTVINKLYNTIVNSEFISLPEIPKTKLATVGQRTNIMKLINKRIVDLCEIIKPEDFWTYFGIILNHKTQSDEMQLHFQKALKTSFFQDSTGRGIQPIYHCYTFDAMCAIKGCRKGSSVLFQKGRGIAVSFFERPQNTVNVKPHWLHEQLEDEVKCPNKDQCVINLNTITPNIPSDKDYTCDPRTGKPSDTELRIWYEDNIEPIYQDFNRNIVQEDAFTAIDIKQHNYREIYNDSGQFISYLLTVVHRDQVHIDDDAATDKYKEECKQFITQIIMLTHSATTHLSILPNVYNKNKNKKNRLSLRQGMHFTSGIKDYSPFQPTAVVVGALYDTEIFDSIFGSFANVNILDLKESSSFNTLFKNQLISFIDAIDNLYHNIINAQYCEPGNVESCSIETAFFLGNYQNLYLIRILYGILCCLIIDLELDDKVETEAFNKNAYELILNSSLNAPSPWVPNQTFKCKTNANDIQFDDPNFRRNKSEPYALISEILTLMIDSPTDMGHVRYLNAYGIINLYNTIFASKNHKGVILLMRTILRHIRIWNSKDCNIKKFLDEYFNERMKSINHTAEISRGVSSQSSAINEFSKNGLGLTKQIEYADEIYKDLKEEKTSVQAIDFMAEIEKDLKEIKKNKILLKKSVFDEKDFEAGHYAVSYKSKDVIKIKKFKSKEDIQNFNIRMKIHTLIVDAILGSEGFAGNPKHRHQFELAKVIARLNNIYSKLKHIFESGAIMLELSLVEYGPEFYNKLQKQLNKVNRGTFGTIMNILRGDQKINLVFDMLTTPYNDTQMELADRGSSLMQKLFSYN